MTGEVLTACAVCLITWSWLLYQLIKPLLKKTRDRYTTELADSIEKTHYIKRQIDACEELLFAIRTSDEHHQRNVQLTWTTETELIKNADIWVDGSSQTTEQLRTLAESKIDYLPTSLFRELDKIHRMRHNNVIQSTALRPLRDRGEWH